MQHAVVEAGFFGRPRLDVRDPVRPGGWDIDQPELGHRKPGGDVRVYPQRTGPARLVVVGVDEEVVDRAGWSSDQGDVSEDPGQPPHVLVLEVTRRRPLVDADREGVDG